MFKRAREYLNNKSNPLLNNLSSLNKAEKSRYFYHGTTAKLT